MSCHPRTRHAAVWPAVQTVSHHVNQQINRDNLRVGDTERDEAARLLGDHFAAGRLDRAEYDERLDGALRARVGGDLARLFDDLPQPRAAYSPGGLTPTGHHGNHGFGLPLLPVLLILIGLAILLDAGWIVWLGLGLLFLARRAQWRRRRARSSRRPLWG